MVVGAPYPAFYDWTWGELIDYINAVYEERQDRRKCELREMAQLSFSTCMTFLKMFSAKRGKKFKLIEEYSYLWSKEEIEQARLDEFENYFMSHSVEEENEE